MILGIGIDLVKVARLTDMHARHGSRLAQRLLAPEELADYVEARDKDRFLAKRFAAKEALAKALGTGLRHPVQLTRIWVEHDALGRPTLGFTPELAHWIERRGIVRFHLSISDEAEHAIAFVIAEGDSP